MKTSEANLAACLLLAFCAGCSDKSDKAASRPERQRVIINAMKEKTAPPAQMRSSVATPVQALRARAELPPSAAVRAGQTRPRKRLRFFGPWFSGSDLGEIQVTLNGPVNSPAPVWYYREFFATVRSDEPEDMRIYRQYVSNAATRNEAPPVLMPVPGAAPAYSPQPRVNKMRFSLAEILATGRYGGSIELRFQSSHDFEYQVATAGKLWDIRDLGMSIFVNPVPGLMNPAGPEMQDNRFRSLKVEFQPSGVTAYDAASGDVQSDNDLASLTAVLQTLADSIAGTSGVYPFQHRVFKREVSQFAHAWMHTQQSDLIDDQSPPEKVDAIELADQHIVLRTSRPEVFFQWTLRILYTSSSAELPVLFQVASAHQVDTHLEDGPIYQQALRPFTQSSPFNIGIFRLATECPTLVLGFISARDGDSSSDPLLRQQFNTSELAATSQQNTTNLRVDLTEDCTAINNFVQTQAPPIPGAVAADRVLFRVQEQGFFLLRENLEIRGEYRLTASLELIYR
jgi:hypothetical protein